MKTEHFWQLFFILVGAFASAYAGYYFVNQPDQNQILEYEYFTDINLKENFGEKNGIHIFYHGKELENLSKSFYNVANLSANNLGKVKLYFEFEGKDNLPIFHSISSHKTIPNKAIKLISKEDGVYIFEIEFFNKMERMWQGLNFNFYFVGPEKPKVVLKSGTKGLEIKKYSFEMPTLFEYIIKGFQKVWWLLFLAFGILYFSTKYEKIKNLLIDRNFKKILTNSINTLSDSPNESVINEIQESATKEPSFSEIMKNWNVKFKA